MKLHSPRFESALRGSLRAAIRASPALKREFREARRFRKHYRAWILIRPAISIGFGLLVLRVAQLTHHPATALALVTCWLFAFVFFHAQGLLKTLYGAGDLPALTFLPVAESTIFEWELRKFARGSLMSMVDGLAAVGLLSWYLGFSPLRWGLAAAVTVLAWLLLLALGILCAARLPRLPYSGISLLFVGSAFLLFFARDFIGHAALDLLDRFGPQINLLVPTGWAVSQFELLLPAPRWSTLALLVPLTAVVLAGQNSLELLRRHYGFREPTLPEVPDLLPEVEPEGSAGVPERESWRVGRTDIEEILQSRQFLRPPAWPAAGRFERLLWRWLNDREKALVEFVFPNGFSVWEPWQKIFRNFAIGCLAAAVMGFVKGEFRGFVLGATLFVTGCQALPRLLNNGRVFQPVLLGGINIPIYAGYPCTFRELAQLLMKCTAVQVPLFLPFFLLAGAGLAYLTAFPFASAFLMGLKCVWLFLSARLMLIVFSFSAGTNDTSRITWRSLMFIIFGVAGGLCFLALGASGLFVPDPVVASALCLLASIEALTFCAIYAFFYNRMRFDLMSLPREQS
jgi:hypothetical protein